MVTIYFSPLDVEYPEYPDPRQQRCRRKYIVRNTKDNNGTFRDVKAFGFTPRPDDVREHHHQPYRRRPTLCPDEVGEHHHQSYKRQLTPSTDLVGERHHHPTEEDLTFGLTNSVNIITILQKRTYPLY